MSGNRPLRGAGRGVRAAIAVSVVAAALLLAGCSSEQNANLAEQWEESSDKGFIAGDGSTVSLPAGERTDPVDFEGTSEFGEKLSSDDFRGEVTVVNFWYAGCAPCRAEAKDLVAVYDEFADQGVEFLGVNTRDQDAQAQQFAEQFGVPYPSVMDSTNERSVQRAFAGQVPLNAVPTTLVLDSQGRVAHRVVGQLAGASQLRTLVTETLAEDEAN